ncbi:hypothetical protein, partial [Streptomyces acidiscabies]|uniref:hypothetical protein n=1 Tax=Streptomyces acidiscabies TaxID=42234 RepID=UPI0038F7A6A6
LAAYDHAGKRLADVPVPPIAAVDEVVATGGGVLAEIATYLRPPYFERYDEASGAVSETKLAETSPVHFDDVTVSREFATSKDGTR